MQQSIRQNAPHVTLHKKDSNDFHAVKYRDFVFREKEQDRQIP